jgi:hypothetical protein
MRERVKNLKKFEKKKKRRFADYTQAFIRTHAHTRAERERESARFSFPWELELRGGEGKKGGWITLRWGNGENEVFGLGG